MKKYIFFTKNFVRSATLHTFVAQNVRFAPFLPCFLTTISINPFNSFIMNKTDLTNEIAKKAGLTKVDAKKALDATIEAITGALKGGDKVALIGFGTFSVAKREARQGVNPQTGAAIKIAAKKQAKFKAGAELDAAIQ